MGTAICSWLNFVDQPFFGSKLFVNPIWEEGNIGLWFFFFILLVIFGLSEGGEDWKDRHR